MWFLFHNKTKTKVVEGGASFVEVCPECGRRARFHEVELTESFGLFFVDLVNDKERKFRCSSCGEVFDRRDEPEATATAAAPPAKSARELERERAVELARRQAEQDRRRALAEAKANRIEDELSELKKRLGR